jgi:hypothetical protein
MVNSQQWLADYARLHGFEYRLVDDDAIEIAINDSSGFVKWELCCNWNQLRESMGF